MFVYILDIEEINAGYSLLIEFVDVSAYNGLVVLLISEHLIEFAVGLDPIAGLGDDCLVFLADFEAFGDGVEEIFSKGFLREGGGFGMSCFCEFDLYLHVYVF